MAGEQRDKQKKLYTSERAKKLIELEAERSDKSQSEIFTELVLTHLGSGDESDISRRLKEIDRRIEELESQIEDRQRELSELKDEKRMLVTKLEQIDDGSVLTEDEVEKAVEILENGHRLMPTADFVEDVAENHDIEPETARDALKERVQDEYDGYPDWAFDYKSPNEPMDWREASAQKV